MTEKRPTEKQPTADDRAYAAQQLAQLLELPLGITITRAEVFGMGSRAAVEITLSNRQCMTFDTFRDLTNVNFLLTELVTCTGATPPLTRKLAYRVAALVRTIARTTATLTDNGVATDWGATYLQHAEIIDVDMNDQAERWAGMTRLAEVEPSNHPRDVPPPNIVLRAIDGKRYVRCSWFAAHVRSTDSGSRDIPTRMARVGWTRPGHEGRVKATRPGFPGQLVWAFYIVPADWENTETNEATTRHTGDEVTASEVLNARAQDPANTRVGAVTCRHPVTYANTAPDAEQEPAAPGGSSTAGLTDAASFNAAVRAPRDPMGPTDVAADEGESDDERVRVDALVAAFDATEIDYPPADAIVWDFTATGPTGT